MIETEKKHRKQVISRKDKRNVVFGLANMGKSLSQINEMPSKRHEIEDIEE